MNQLAKNFCTVICVIVIFSLNGKARAEEKVLCSIYSDIDSNYAEIVGDFSEDYRNIKSLHQNSYEANKLIKRVDIPFSELKDGVVLDSEGSYVTVVIKSDNFNDTNGGGLILDTLYSGITGKRRQYGLNASFEKNGFSLSVDGKSFNKMLFIANRTVLFGVVGIETIRFEN